MRQEVAPPRERVYASNRRAFYEYTILESLEVGIVLTGTEIKSVRDGKVNLREGYARVDRGELWLYNAHISPYDAGNRYNHDPIRPRKLLAHTREVTLKRNQSSTIEWAIEESKPIPENTLDEAPVDDGK